MKIADILENLTVKELRKLASNTTVRNYNMKRKAELIQELTDYYYDNRLPSYERQARNLLGMNTQENYRHTKYCQAASSVTHETWLHGETTFNADDWTLIAVSKNNIITSVIIQLCGEEVKREEG